ncbi:MAG: lipid II flippase MurJ [Burkholderiaceae bacterium]
MASDCRLDSLSVPRVGRELANASVIVVVGNVCAGSLMVADRFPASQLGQGSVATLGYATRLLMLPATLASLAIARSLLPIFSELSAQHDYAHLRQLVNRFAAGAFAIGLVLALLIWLLAPWLVQIAFERGSFDAEATARTAGRCAGGVFQLPGFAAAMVVVQALLSQRRYAVVAASGVFNLLAKLGLNALLAPVIGVPGITLATAIVLTASFVLMWWLLQR